jgi:hypothetical protein
MGLLILVFSETLSRLLVFTETLVNFTVSALDEFAGSLLLE